MPDEILMRRNELLEWGIDIVEMNIGNKTVNTGVDAGRLRPMQVASCRDEVSQHLQIRDAAIVSSSGSVTADALVVIALRIEFLRLAQPRVRQACMLPAQRSAEGRPEPLVLPA